MPRTTADSEAWKRIVLQAMPLPAWLNEDGPRRDIVLSTRVRIMRNLRGFRFPHLASPTELKEAADQVAFAFSSDEFEWVRRASPAERDYLVACRLVSPDFDWKAPGRAVVLDSQRSRSIMVNEEDHLRIQAVFPGWSFKSTLQSAEQLVESASGSLEFAKTEEFGYLAASVFNAGQGRRHSAMFHLIGLAHVKRLTTVLRALATQGLVVRGLFGERSRAIGAFVQVSTTGPSIPNFVGACDYLLEQESRARGEVPLEEIEAKAEEAAHFLQNLKALSLADALRVLAWIRWRSCAEPRSSISPREIDARIPELALLETLDESRAGRSRLEMLKRALGVRPA